jgi:hypothetical protein
MTADLANGPGTARQRWRALLLALGVLALAQSVVMAYFATTAGNLGMALQRTGAQHVDRIVVDPGGAAAAGGARTGDLLDIEKIAAGERYRLRYGVRAGVPVVLPLEREGTPRPVTIVPPRAPLTWDEWLSYAAEAWIALFCLLLAWRCPENRQARTLVLFLLGAFVIGQTNWLTSNATFDAVADTIAKVLRWSSGIFLISYAGFFGRPLTTLRRSLAAFAYCTIALTVALTVTIVAGVWIGADIPLAHVGSMRALLCVTQALLLFAAIAAARGVERTQVTWATVAIAPLLLWVAATDYLPGFAFIGQIGVDLGFLVVPVVLTYSLLNRRLIDIGFIFNRAAVFAAVSLVLIGAFVLAEWLLTEWLREASHATNLLAGAALALALGLSVRAVHRRIDRLVDGVFFRKRYEDERAIETFALETPYITDRTILLQRTSAVLARHTDASSVELLLDDGAGRFGEIAESDPAIVRLRATREPVRLHELPEESSVTGDLAFPMVARGHLRGAIVLGARESGESYAPDEAAAIAHLGQSVGAALDALSRPSDGIATVVAAIDALRAELALRLPANPTPNTNS